MKTSSLYAFTSGLASLAPLVAKDTRSCGMTNAWHRQGSRWRVVAALCLVAWTGRQAAPDLNRSAGENCARQDDCESNLCDESTRLKAATDDDLDGLTNEIEVGLGLGLDPTNSDSDGLPDQKDDGESTTAPATLEMANIACCCAGGCAKCGGAIEAVTGVEVDGEMALTCNPNQPDTDGDTALDARDRCPLDAPDEPALDMVCEPVDNCHGWQMRSPATPGAAHPIIPTMCRRRAPLGAGR
jgi:hypothetical protein